jgi:predicted Zn-dependent protease with MMP-like domain
LSVSLNHTELGVCHAHYVPYHVSADDFERIAAAALDSIPTPLRARMDADNLMITVQSAASPDDIDSDIDVHVLGFYEGSEDSVFSAYSFPKRIVLLQGHIEHWSDSYAELVDQVHDTVLHEVAHYFGMSHDDIAQTRLRH